jgi:hypothetical protein
VKAQGLFHFWISMVRGQSRFWVLFVCALATACAENGGRIDVAAPEPVSTVAQAELHCFEGENASLLDNRPLVVAVLSPRMVYSLLEWPNMAREAEALGFRVRAWRDPRVPEGEWRQALSSLAYLRAGVLDPEPLPSDCLNRWAPIDHLPLAQILLDRQLHSWPLWGVMTPDAWRTSLLNRLASLRREAIRVGSH